jgi:hypothetical protein
MRLHTEVIYWVDKEPSTGKITAVLSGNRYIIDFKHVVHGRDVIEKAALKRNGSTSVSFRRSLRPLFRSN